MMKVLLALTCALAVVMGASQAQASTIIYDGGSPNQEDAHRADAEGPVFPAAGESFVLQSGASTVTDAHWWGTCTVGECPIGDFTLSFYTDSAGLPLESRLVVEIR